MSRTIICPRCKGTGLTENLSYTIIGCELCGGSNIEKKTFWGGGTKTQTKKGTGKIKISENPCKSCNGKGRHYWISVNEYRREESTSAECDHCYGSGYELNKS